MAAGLFLAVQVARAPMDGVHPPPGCSLVKGDFGSLVLTERAPR